MHQCDDNNDLRVSAANARAHKQCQSRTDGSTACDEGKDVDNKTK